MASKGEAANTRYESAKRTRTSEAVESTKDRVGREEAASHRSEGRVSSRTDSSKTRAKLCESLKGGNRVKRTGSMVKPAAGKCPPPRSEKKQRCAPDTPAGESSRTGVLDLDRCLDKPYRYRPQPCVKPKEKWQNGVYCRDECGSGIISKKFEFKHSRHLWCRTPLTMYQATIGELGRQILCGEKVIPRDVKPAPPGNVCEYILPLCRGYYRKYDCVRPCEEQYASYKQGKRLYRDRVERYWEPCETKDQKITVDVNTFAHHNVFLGEKLRRKFDDVIPCW